MAKKKSSRAGSQKIFNIIALLLGVATLAMLFLSVVKNPDTTVLGATIKGAELSGLEVAFGYSENSVKCLSFSFMALLPWLLALIGVVLTIINVVSKKATKIFTYISIVLFVGAGVMFFLMPNFMVFADSISGVVLKNLTWKLAIGSIIAGVCSILSGVVLLAGSLNK